MPLSQSLLRDASRLWRSAAGFARWPTGAGRQPSRLTLGVAATSVVAMAGVAAGVSFGSTPAAGAVGSARTTSHVAGRRAAAGSATRSVAASPSATPSSQPAPHATPTAATQSPAPQQPAPAPQPYLIYDSTTPAAIPPGQVVATYATGPGAVPASQVAGRTTVLWIDVTGTDYAASVLDVEPGNASPSTAASWAYNRLSADPTGVAIIYTMISEWQTVQAAVATLPSWMQSHIRWWIADPTGVAHVVPGAQATQWYWGPNYDISTALPDLLTP